MIIVFFIEKIDPMNDRVKYIGSIIGSSSSMCNNPSIPTMSFHCKNTVDPGESPIFIAVDFPCNLKNDPFNDEFSKANSNPNLPAKIAKITYRVDNFNPVNTFGLILHEAPSSFSRDINYNWTNDLRGHNIIRFRSHHDIGNNRILPQDISFDLKHFGEIDRRMQSYCRFWNR